MASLASTHHGAAEGQIFVYNAAFFSSYLQYNERGHAPRSCRSPGLSHARLPSNVVNLLSCNFVIIRCHLLDLYLQDVKS